MPLNPLLYNNLKRVFGRVRISCEGVAMTARYVPRVLQEGEKLHIDVPGEEYRVNCDRCNDTRFRLNINHVWGRRDEKGRRNLHLVWCYNERCYEKNRAAVDDLLDKLATLHGDLAAAPILKGKEHVVLDHAEPPGPIQRLDTLPPDHPANAYLALRMFSPERLGRFYGVGYCPTSFYTLAGGRIYIPLYARGKLKGWQMRRVGDGDTNGVIRSGSGDDDDGPPHKRLGPPKYFSCPNMGRGQLLYNLDNAVRYRTVVVMEGPAKVWTLGPMGVATLGFPMTDAQRGLIEYYFADWTVVLLFDPDVQQNERTKRKYDEIVEAMRGKFRGGLAAIVPPDQPDNLERGFLRRFIVQEAMGQGVRVSWATR